MRKPRLAVALLAASSLTPIAAFADDTWSPTPGSNSYNTASNWAGNAVPTGGATAFFNASNTTNLTISSTVSPGALQFNAGAPAYSFAVTSGTELELTGAGIVNNSSNAPTITADAATVRVSGSATLGNASISLNNGSSLVFSGNSSGGAAAVAVGSNATVDISNLTSAGTTFRSLSGTGGVALGAKQLNLSVDVTSGSALYNGTISGTGSLVKSGTGGFVLGGANTYSGGTTVSAGVFEANVQGALGSGNVFIDSGATMRVVPNSDITIANRIDSASSGTFIKHGSGTLTLTGNNSTNFLGTMRFVAGAVAVSSDANLGGTLVFDGGTLQTTATMTGTRDITVEHLSVGGTLSPAAGTTLTWTGVIAGGLEKTGEGTLVLANALNSIGVTIIRAGTLSISSDSNLGASSGDILISGGALRTTASTTTSRNVTLQLGGTGTFNTDAGTTLTLNGQIDGTGSLAKSGDGTLILNGFNTYSGSTTTISGGKLQGNTSSVKGDINFTGPGTIVFDQAADATYSGTIAGAGALTKSNAGTLILTGNHTNTGSIDISGGTLQIGNGGFSGALGSGDISISSGATLAFNRNGNVATTVSNAISGGGGVRQQAPGSVLTLTAGNSYAGDTTIINNGIIAVSSSSNLGAADNRLVFGIGTLRTTASLSSGRAVVLNSGGVFETDAGTVLRWSGDMSGVGDLVKAGEGTLVLSGTNSNFGGTTVIAGTLQLDSGGSLAVGRRLRVNGGTVDLNGQNQTVGDLSGTGGTIALGAAMLTAGSAANTTVTSSIIGTGGLVKIGSGTMTLAGTNTYTGGTIVSAGTLKGNATSLQGDIVNNAAVAFVTAGGTFAGAISGTGSLSVQSSGTLILTGSNSYTGGTTVAGGMLQGTTTSLQGNIVNNATVAFNQASAGTYAGNMSGSGSLTVLGGGTLTLAGTNSYSGGTTVLGGTLQGNSASLQGNITNNAAVVFNQGSTGIYAGNMSGTGSLTMQGGGLLNMTGANTYTGPTTINSGTLAVNGSLASGVTVIGGGLIVNGSLAGGVTLNGGSMVLDGIVGGASVMNGGMLSGAGTMGSLALNGGTFAPGNSIGTFTVTGSFVQNGGTYQVEANNLGQSDRLNVGGTATINGGVVQVLAQPGTYARNTTYTILNAAGGVAGVYASVTSNFAFLSPTLSYDANNVYLLLAQSSSAFASGAQTSNQYAVGSALDRANASATGDFNTVLNALSALNTAQGPAALNAISGQNYSGFSSAMVQGAQLFMSNFQTQAGGGHAGRGGKVALAEACDVACDATPPGLWSAWGGALGGLGTIGGNTNAGTLTYNVGGFAAGLDHRFSSNLLVGITMGYTTGTQWVDGFSGRGVANTLQAGLYAGYSEGPLYVDGLVGYAYSANQMWRTIAIPGLQPRTAQGVTGANQFYGQVEAGYCFDLGGAAEAFVTPFARLQAYTGTQNAFTETGAQSLDLNVAAQTTNSLRSVLGAQIDGAMDLGWREKLHAQIRLGWSHEYADTNRPVTASFAGAPTLPFTTYGAVPQRDGVLIGLAANTAVAEATSVYLRYEGDISGQDSSHALTVGVRMRW